jgi:hypothetical protein
MTRQTAIDIECAPRTDPPDFDDSAGNWETFAVALSQRTAASSMPETETFVRPDGSDRGLCKLLGSVANWLHEHRPHDALLSFNGGELDPDSDGFDLPILDDHIDTELKACDPELAEYVGEALDIPSRDLMAEIADAQPDSEKWPSLSEALTSRGLAQAPARLDGVALEGADMPTLGEQILSGEGLSAQEDRALREYASSDVVPLHALADALDRERRSGAEADAATDGGHDAN